MIGLLAATLAVLAFAAILAVTKIAAVAARAVSLSVEGVSVILDRELSEDEKELRVRRAGLALIAVAWGIAWRFAAALGVAALPVLAADGVGLVSAGGVLDLMLTWEFILGSTVALSVAVYLFRRFGRAGRQEELGETAYSSGDRLVHVLAFSSPAVMKGLARLDGRLARNRMAQMPETPPVFVTSLARGGTTALLNALSDDPSFASMQYRDMPFVTAPFLWSRLSSRSRNVERQDRAHGDGIKIDLDSPEAFDEVFWMLGWPGKYRDDGIEPWTATDLDDGVTPMMTDAFRRVALVRGMARSAPPQSHVHYLSKNNVNIARIGLLKRMFPDCRVVIALRRPGQHALSLWRQDQRFLTIHAEQPFTRRYMRDIGHFEFGALHRPVRFDAFDPLAIDRSLPDYWLSYWITAFRHLSAQRDQCIFVTQDNLRQAPGKTMTNLFDAMMITPKKTDFSAAFHDFPDEVDKGRFAAPLLAQATSLYEELARLSV